MKTALIMKLCNNVFLPWLKTWLMSLKVFTFIASHTGLKFHHCGKKDIIPITDNILTLMTIHVYPFSQDFLAKTQFAQPPVGSIV